MSRIFAAVLMAGLGALLTPAQERAVGRQSPQSQPAGRRLAFLVGINDYVHQPRLRYCRQDVQLVRQTLVEHGRFDPRDVITLVDGGPANQAPTFGAIMERLPHLLEAAGPDDLVFVYLSGHGAQFEDERQKRGYFIPVDGASRVTSVPLDWLRGVLDDCRARSKVLVLDACRNDTIGSRGARSLDGTTFRDARGTSFATLFSCAPGQLSREDEKFGQGVFTKFLIDGLRGAADENGDKRVDLAEAHRYARLEVQRWGFQKGADQGPILEGSLADPIYLTFSTESSGVALPASVPAGSSAAATVTSGGNGGSPVIRITGSSSSASGIRLVVSSNGSTRLIGVGDSLDGGEVVAVSKRGAIIVEGKTYFRYDNDSSKSAADRLRLAASTLDEALAEVGKDWWADTQPQLQVIPSGKTKVSTDRHESTPVVQPRKPSGGASDRAAAFFSALEARIRGIEGAYVHPEFRLTGGLTFGVTTIEQVRERFPGGQVQTQEAGWQSYTPPGDVRSFSEFVFCHGKLALIRWGGLNSVRKTSAGFQPFRTPWDRVSNLLGPPAFTLKSGPMPEAFYPAAGLSFGRSDETVGWLGVFPSLTLE